VGLFEHGSPGYGEGFGSFRPSSPASLRTLIRRIGQRLTKLGLKLRVVRSRGVMLTISDDSDAQGA
jgi:hypothetical protein